MTQDYDLQSISIQPALHSVEEIARVIVRAFTAARCDVHTGSRLPGLFAQAGIGAPDGTDVSGRLEPLADTRRMLSAVYTSLLPVAVTHGVTTTLEAFNRDVERFPKRPVLWPLLIGAWKRKHRTP